MEKQCTIHLFDLSYDDEKEIYESNIKKCSTCNHKLSDDSLNSLDIIKIILKKKYPKIIEMAKSYDMLENISTTGERSEGIYFIVKTETDFKILDRTFKYDDYGNPPKEILTFKHIPINYYLPENCILNNYYFPEIKETQLYWHGDEVITLFIDFTDIKIVENTFTYDNKLYYLQLYYTKEIKGIHALYYSVEDGKKTFSDAV